MENPQLTIALEWLTVNGIISSGWTTFGDAYELASGESVSDQQLSDALADFEAARVLVATRKTWPTVADFYAEFTPTEKYLIQSSTIPAIVVARGDLAMMARRCHRSGHRRRSSPVAMHAG